MFPRHHILLGLSFSLILLILFPKIGFFGFLLIFLSSILIDVDHYIYYVCKKKDFNFINSYKWFVKAGKKIRSFPREKRKNYYVGFLFLHGIETLILLFFLSLIWNLLFFVLIGAAFHLFLDVIHSRTLMGRWDKVSALVDFIKFKKVKFIEKNER